MKSYFLLNLLIILYLFIIIIIYINIYLIKIKIKFLIRPFGLIVCLVTFDIDEQVRILVRTSFNQIIFELIKMSFID